jgi:hypothetical protein
MLDLLWKRHSQAGLQMLFHNTSPLGGQAQPRIFSQQYLREAKAQGYLRSKMSDGFSESRASTLAKGFESTAPAWLVQAEPCASLPIRVNPAHPWLRIVSFHLVVLAKMILPKKNVERRASRFESLLTSYPLPVTFPSALMILLTTNHTNLHE